MSDSIIYEAQPIPPEGPQEGRRWSAIFGGVALIAVLLIGVAFGAALFRGDDEPDPLADPDPNQPTVTVPQVTTTVAQSPFADRFARDESGAYSTRPGRGGGGGDVGAPTPALPAQEFTWEKITLDLPAGAEAYLQGVYAVNDGFIAIGTAYNETGQDLVAWTSTDGTTWTKGALNGDFSNASVWNFMFNEHGGIAFGEAFLDSYYAEGDDLYAYPEAPSHIVWTTPDGLDWTRSEIDFAADVNQSVWLNSGVAGPDGYLVIGQRQTTPEFEPMVIEKDGYQLIISDYTYTYQLLDAAGSVVAEGTMEDIYRHDDYDNDGQAVLNPDTGEVIVVVPYEEWEMAWETAYSQSSGGPFGGYGGYEPAVVTIDYDGYRITVDEEQGTYIIEDLTSGEVLFSGPADYLWRGPSPVIFDGEGNEILRLSWEEFDGAQQAFWERVETDEYAYRSELVVATSSDGVTWNTSTVDNGSVETSFDSIVVKDGQYFAYGNHFDEYGGGPAIWSSSDGVSWDRVADMPGGMYVWNVKETPDGTLLAMGDGPQGASLWSSVDGIAWGEAFGARVPEDRSLYEWLNQFGTGELGTVVVGSRESNYYGEDYYSDPLSLTQDEYTLTFDDYDWPPRVTIVDNITGDVVIDEFLKEEGGLPEGFFYEDGVTIIENNDLVLMTITDEEWYAAQDDRWIDFDGGFAYERPDTTVYFSADLETWTEVSTTFEGWINTVAVGSDVIILAGEEGGEEVYPLEAGSGVYDEDFIYTPPTPVLWVGRP
ncbi:MAG: hypothetical protein OER12_03200 [Acidimicrobiia bacterium]|nr:hypothetical protein [Acidimicrobiia bacterium]